MWGTKRRVGISYSIIRQLLTQSEVSSGDNEVRIFFRTTFFPSSRISAHALPVLKLQLKFAIGKDSTVRATSKAMKAPKAKQKAKEGLFSPKGGMVAVGDAVSEIEDCSPTIIARKADSAVKIVCSGAAQF